MTMRSVIDVPRDLEFNGELCRAFVNTGARRPDERCRASDPPLETPAFADYGGFPRLGSRVRVLERDDTERLSRAVDEEPEKEMAVFARALALRQAFGVSGKSKVSDLRVNAATGPSEAVAAL